MFEPPVFFEQLGVKYLGPLRRPRPRRARARARAAVEFDGPVVVHCLTQKGRGYGPAEDDDIKNMHDTSELKAGLVHRCLLRGHRRRRAQAARGGGHHRRHARLDRAPALRRGVPRAPVRRGHRRTARDDRRRRHGHGRPPPVVAVYSTFLTRAFDQVNLDVGLHSQPVVFVLDRAGITGDDGAVPPRPARHGAAVEGAQHDAVRPVELRRGRPDAARRPRPVHRRAGRHPLPEDRTARRRPRGRARACRPDARRCAVPRSASSAWARCSHRPDRLPIGSSPRATTSPCGTPGSIKPLDPEMLADAANHRLVVTIEDGLRDGGAGSAIADALGKLGPNGGPQVRVLGVPVRVPRARQARHDPHPARPRCRRHRRRGAGVGLVHGPHQVAVAAADVLRPDGPRPDQ